MTAAYQHPNEDSWITVETAAPRAANEIGGDPFTAMAIAMWTTPSASVDDLIEEHGEMWPTWTEFRDVVSRDVNLPVDGISMLFHLREHSESKRWACRGTTDSSVVTVTARGVLLGRIALETILRPPG